MRAFTLIASVVLPSVALWAGADVTGAWSGPMFYLTFQQDGGKLSGTGGFEAKEQHPFTGGAIDGDRLVFHVGEFNFDLRVAGDTLKGEMKSGERTMEVSLDRVSGKNRVAPTAFEVASIKPNVSNQRSSSTRTLPGGELIMENETLKEIVLMAYNVRDFTFSGPAWLDTVKFDIMAKAPSPVTRDERRVLMQSLLAERFKLVVHRETKTLSAYELVLSKGGLKVKPVEPGFGGANSGRKVGKSVLDAKKISMARFADLLGDRLGRPVVDKTEVKGVFDIKLEWLLDDSASSDADFSAGATIFTALQEQLGLRLVAQKLPVDIVVVDHVERVPTEN